MQPVSDQTFGPLIAYLVPGATALIGISEFSPTIAHWFEQSQSTSPTLGGFLYLTVASIAVGMTISALRWATIDRLHELTGINLPPLDFSRLGANVTAFQLLIEIHYRHYLFYSNVALALAIAYVPYRAKHLEFSLIALDIGFIFLEVVLLAASRDTLRKYYSRAGELLGFNDKLPPVTKGNAVAPSKSRGTPTTQDEASSVTNYSSPSRSTKSNSERP